MRAFRIIKGGKNSGKSFPGPEKPIVFEVLEPRILLSADSLTGAFDDLRDNNPAPYDIVQHAELLGASDEFDASSPSPHTSYLNEYQPIYTFKIDSENSDEKESENDRVLDEPDTDI